MAKLRSEQMRSEGIRSEHGARSTELHGCYRRLLLEFISDVNTSMLMCRGILWNVCINLNVVRLITRKTPG